MIIIPAIDLKDGQCVRLTHGDADRKTVYSDDPVSAAKKWVGAGARRLHVVDLDGAFTGAPKNLDWVVRIKKETGAFVQTGGGIRTLEAIESILSKGIDRVILGTVVFEVAGLAMLAFQEFKNRIMVAMDVKNNFVATRGWTQSSGTPVKEALKLIEKLGGEEVIYTDVSRDGTLAGVNVTSVQDVMALTPLTVFASGGVTSLKDVQALKAIQSPGCVIGKALYEGTLRLEDAVRAAAG